jgi:hypothetical protein
MAKTDNPLKQLVTLGIADFAAWLLGVEIVAAEPQTIELPPATDAIRPDQVFLITLLDDRTVILHIEFQGRTSHRPMPFRVLEYMTRLTETYREIPCTTSSSMSDPALDDTIPASTKRNSLMVQ